MFFRLYSGDMPGMFIYTHSRMACLSDRARPTVAIAPIATPSQARLNRFWCCHSGIAAEMSHAARAIEMNSGGARKSAKILFKPGVFRGVIRVPDVHLDHRSPVPSVCDMAVFMIVAHAHN
jgi:hypothetical protein